MYIRNILMLSVITIAFQSSTVNSKFPDNPQPCKYGDTECIAKTIQFLLHERSGGDKSVNLIATDPLKIKKINLKQGGASPVNIDLLFTDNELIGISNNNIYKVKGFDKDMKQEHELHMKFKAVHLVGAYKINGRVLVLPISGTGKSNLTIVNVDVDLRFKGEPFDKDGATFMKLENMKMTLKPERVYYYFGNLFNGDKLLGDNMNLFLNENWLDIFNEVHDVLVEAFAKIFEQIINNVFAKYPYEKYFLD